MLDFLTTTLLVSTPLLFAATGGMIGEICGVPLICLEGGMLLGAFTAASLATLWPSLWIGVFVALLLCSLLFWIQGILVGRLGGNPIILGTALNLLALGITPLLSKNFFGTPTSTPSLPYGISQNFMMGLSVFLFVLFILLLRHTSFGLRLRACGDNIHALEAVGLRANQIQELALAGAGSLTALGGIYLSLAQSHGFTREMTAGRGFIALAAVLMAKKHPHLLLFACLLFGACEAFQVHIHSLTIPSQVIQGFPYFCTLVFLGIASRRSVKSA